VCDRGNSSVSGEGDCEREKMTMRCGCGNKEKESKNWTEGKERRCRMCREDSETTEHMWSGCTKMREREGKERGEILSKDGKKDG
jgi:hypothetical protein